MDVCDKIAFTGVTVTVDIYTHINICTHVRTNKHTNHRLTTLTKIWTLTYLGGVIHRRRLVELPPG